MSLIFVDGESPTIIEKKCEVIKNVLHALDSDTRYLIDSNLSLLVTSQDGRCCDRISILPDEGCAWGRYSPPRVRLRYSPSPDFFEKITFFEGPTGSLSNPYVYYIRDDGSIRNPATWHGQPTICVDEFVKDLKRAGDVAITKVNHKGGFVRPPYNEEWAVHYNHQIFIDKNNQWFKDFIHVEWGPTHSLYCLYTEKMLDEWWKRITKELLRFDESLLTNSQECIQQNKIQTIK